MNTFIDEIYSKPPKKIYVTNKINIYHIDDTWSIDLLDLNDYGPKNNRGYRYCLIVIDNFSKYGWAIPIKNKNSQTIKDKFSHILDKRKPKNLESDRGKEFYNSTFQNFLKLNNINHYSRYTDKGPSIVERFNRTIRDMVKKPIFLKGNASWIDEIDSVINKYNNKIHSTIKLTPIQASLKENEEYVYQNLIDKRKKIKPKFQVNDLVRTADLKKTFSKGDTTNWSYKLYKITEVINDTIPKYRINNLPERYNQSLLLKSQLTMEENDEVMLNLRLGVKASGLNSFKDFLLKYNLKDEATSNIKIQEVLKNINLSNDVGIYMRDDDFNTDIGIVNLHPYKGTHWVCYIKNKYFDSYGCSPPENIKNYIKSKCKSCIYSEYQIQKYDSLCASYCLYIIYYTTLLDFKKAVLLLYYSK